MERYLKYLKRKNVQLWIAGTIVAVGLGLLLGYEVVRPVIAKRACKAKVDNLKPFGKIANKKVDYSKGMYEECIRSINK